MGRSWRMQAVLPHNAQPRHFPSMRSALAVGIIVSAWVLLVADVEPVPTWFYVIVWYPTLVLFADRAARRSSEASMWIRPRVMLPMLAWSVPIWLLFEAANFRLRNWYYVLLPAHPIERWTGVALSFATVVPAVVLSSQLFTRLRGLHGPRVRITRPQLRIAELVGLTTGAMALVWPSIFFPLIWGAVWLLVDPYVYRRCPDWSLLGDLERGRWGRVASLLAGGLLIGLLWEFYNYWARGKWIYTVPWLEDIKLFEMPPFGFLGFPVFALEAWTLFHAVCVMGLAQAPSDSPEGRRPARPLWIRLGAVGLAVTFSIGTLLGMERLTISSTVPRLEDIPVGSAELVTLRGMGTEHAGALQGLEIRTVCALAAAEPTTIWTDLHRDRATWDRPTEAEVRIWVRAARRQCPGD